CAGEEDYYAMDYW
nr:immunoglobulin heavy chain junction region [Mus musculus]